MDNIMTTVTETNDCIFRPTSERGLIIKDYFGAFGRTVVVSSWYHPRVGEILEKIRPSVIVPYIITDVYPIRGEKYLYRLYLEEANQDDYKKFGDTTER